MLQKDFWRSVAENKITDEVMAYAQERLDKLVTADAEKVAERKEIQQKIFNFLVDMEAKKVTAREVGEAIDASTQKASYHLVQLAKEGVIESFDGKPKEYASFEGDYAESPETTE